ncbi:oxidoreductase [Brevibacillus choshinensis]|uniref:Oxidoreductase n=1 Tax=Brevibacillus choshinensis TaxID=54911 RepID=A0ABR5NE43_BRECH|nr:SDR family oxidoreductase [Brevibacillus choshinensis]KQL49763.1 oxidoreductase [Brevibacillus choshinensis]
MEQKVAIITGASSGIGAATAKELAKAGVKVMLAARRAERMVQLQQELEADGGEACYQVADVTSLSDMEALAQKTIERFGKIDILVNNAGISPFSYLHKRRVQEWDQMIDVNIKGVLNGIAAVLPHMEERNEGHIINLSSVAGHEITPVRVVYSATKFSVRVITEGLRRELRPDQQIRTTLISPGAVETEISEGITDQEAIELLGRQASEQQALHAEDIARIIRFAVEQPSSVAINEIVVRPTSQRR